jgi:hypothetical protein
MAVKEEISLVAEPPPPVVIQKRMPLSQETIIPLTVERTNPAPVIAIPKREKITPELKINLPEELRTTQAKVEATGTVINAKSFYINGKEINVRASDKKFYTILPVKKGLNVITFTAVSRTGEVTETQKVIIRK